MAGIDTNFVSYFDGLNAGLAIIGWFVFCDPSNWPDSSWRHILKNSDIFSYFDRRRILCPSLSWQ